MRYDDVVPGLRAAYDGGVDFRERHGGFVAEWKEAERIAFATRLRAEGASTLLDVGAGTGVHGRWFADEGFDVTCADLSPGMVEACRAKGLDAVVSDFLSLDSPEPFGALFAFNCLLHVPPADLPRVLTVLRGQLRPSGLFYLGQYGGADEEGVAEADDAYDPPRYFSWVSDETLQAVVADQFDVVEFHVVRFGGEARDTFQSLVLRRSQLASASRSVWTSASASGSP